MSDPLKLALFGTPIKTSLSPFIHIQFAQQAGIEVDYTLIDTGPDKFPEQLEAFKLGGGIGCNITLPLKRQAWQLSARASKHVLAAQAANTLVRQSTDDWMAHTTDGIGLLTDLKANQGMKLDGQRILVLGAGGAAAGILGNLLDENPRALVVVNRNIERAEKMIRQFEYAKVCSVVGWEKAAELPAFDLVVNATSLGHQGQVPALTPSMFVKQSLCYDLNYFKASLPLRKYCKSMAITYVDGLGMLVEQAAKSFYLWTGFQPETKSVIRECQNRAPEPV